MLRLSLKHQQTFYDVSPPNTLKLNILPINPIISNIKTLKTRDTHVRIYLDLIYFDS